MSKVKPIVPMDELVRFARFGQWIMSLSPAARDLAKRVWEATAPKEEPR